MRKRSGEEAMAELCRYADAARPPSPRPDRGTRGGFDGQDHPEYAKTVRILLRQLRLSPQEAAGLMDGDLGVGPKIQERESA